MNEKGETMNEKLVWKRINGRCMLCGEEFEKGESMLCLRCEIEDRARLSCPAPQKKGG